MVPTKRAAGDEAAPPPRRPRVTAAAPGSSNPEPPLKRFLSIVLVVLFFKRPYPKGRSTDSVPVSLSRIGRLEMELGRVRDTLCTLLRKQAHIEKLIRALSSKLDNITGPFSNHRNHERLTRQGTNQEGTSAEAEGSAEKETQGKDASIRLRFCSEMKPPVYHDDEIKSIRVGIFDGDTIIASGPFSKLKIEVLALEGSFPYDAWDSWTSKEFHEHIAYGRDGKGNVLAGKGTNAQLINGECHLGSIRFREGSCRARNGRFIVGARVCDGQTICGRVQEAVMNPVVVQDRRNKYNEKSHPPNLDDSVYRLEKISMKGEYHKRLENENIHTVEHFLKALYKDEDNLARILQIKKKCKDWNKMVHHAQECCLQGKPELKSYPSYPCEETNVVLFFNYIHRLVGARFGCRYIASDMFDPAQQNLVDKLKKNVYDQLDDLTEDHVMMDNIPVPISMNIDGDAGPSRVTSIPQHINSGHHIAVHQVGGTPASEVLSPRAPTEPSFRENAHGPNSIPDPNSTHNYQACNTKMLQNVHSIGGTAVEGLSHVLIESPFAIAKDGPGPSFSLPDHLTTQINYQDQGTWLPAGQEQHYDVLSGMCMEDSLVDAQAFCFQVPDVHEEDDRSAFLRHQADTNNWGAQGLHQGEMQSLVGWPGSDTLEASASARIYMVPTPQLLNNTGAPGSGQGGIQNQTQASLPNDGTTVSSGSAQQALPPHQWSQCQGNMPGNTSF